jgi:hypothetical protein
MSSIGRLFIAGLWLVGLGAGLVLIRAPDLPLPVPALTIPLAAALLIDLALMVPALRSGRLGQITMQDRAIGVIGASLIAIVVTALAGR